MRSPPRELDFSPRLEIQRLLDLVAFRIAEKDAIERKWPDLPPTKRDRVNKIFDLAQQAAEAWDSGHHSEARQFLSAAYKADRRWRDSVSVRGERDDCQN